MATQYTDILKLALPVQGELTGTWGNTINDEITTMVEQAIAGLVTIDVWAADSHTLSIVEGAVSESRAAILRLTDTTVDLSGAGTLITPAQSKVYIVENNTGQVITIKTSAGTGVAIPNTKTGLVFCDGVNVEDGISYLPYNNATSGLTATTVQTAIDEVDADLDALTASLGTASTYDVGTAAGELPTNTDTDAKYLPFTGGVITGDTSITGAFTADGNFNVCSEAEDENPIFNRAEDFKGGQAISQKRSRGTLLAPTSLIDEDVVAGFTSQPHDGTEYLFTAAVRSKVDGTPTTGSVPQKVVIETSIGTANEFDLVERVVVKPDGKVGIGTATPATELDLVGDLTVSGAINLAGNVLTNPLDYGLGATGSEAPDIVSFDTVSRAGTYNSDDTAAGAPASSNILNTWVSTSETGAGFGHTGTIVLRGDQNTATDIRAWVRAGKPSTSEFTNWAELYHDQNSVNPLDYGLGTPITTNAPNIVATGNTQVKSGIYRDTTTASFVYGASILSMRYSALRQCQLAIRTTGDTPGVGFRTMPNDSGVWSGPYELYGEHNSVNPLDFGIGNVDTSSETNLNLAPYTTEGMTTVSQLLPSMTNKPTDNFTTARYIVEFRGNTSNGVQRVTNRTSGDTFQRAFSADVPTAWEEIYTSGNSVNPLDYGLGGGTAPLLTDFTAVMAAGHYRCTLSTVIGGPDTSAFQASVLVENSTDNGGQQFIVKRQTANPDNLLMWLGGRTTNSGAITWVEIYHSGNTNFNVFGGLANNDTIATGWATSTTRIKFYMPINSTTAPSSIDVVGTFQISEIDGTSPVSGVVPVLSAGSSNKMLVISYDDVGLTAKTPYRLLTTNTSSITVNF